MIRERRGGGGREGKEGGERKEEERRGGEEGKSPYLTPFQRYLSFPKVRNRLFTRKE